MTIVLSSKLSRLLLGAVLVLSALCIAAEILVGRPGGGEIFIAVISGGLLLWLNSIRLSVADDEIIYQISGRTRKILIGSIERVERYSAWGRNSTAWAIYTENSPDPVVVPNVDPQDIVRICKILSKRNPRIKFEGIPKQDPPNHIRR